MPKIKSCTSSRLCDCEMNLEKMSLKQPIILLGKICNNKISPENEVPI